MHKYFSMQYFPIVFFINSILLSLLKILSKFSFQSKICLLCDNWERKETPNNIYFMPDIYPVQIVAILPKSTLFIQISNENTYFRSYDHLFLPISITDAFSILLIEHLF
jgi:hypothetical protein